MQHIRSAKKNGADLIKIQTYEEDDMVVKKNFKIKSGLWKDNNLLDLYKKPRHHTHGIMMLKLAKKLNICLFSTPLALEL